MSERDNRVKAFEKLMRGGLSSTDVFCLKNQLMTMGFFTAPASTKYHGNYEGGLFDHSFTVTSSLLSLTKRMGLNWKRKASPYIVVVAQLVAIYKTHKSIKKHFDEF